jgi:phage/plasmid-like protein (TIGR03299 family)
VAHEIEQFTDGTAAFFSSRMDAWHRLGTVTTGCLTAAQVMEVAYLGGWDVRKETVQTVQSAATVPNRWATTRIHPKTGRREVLGMVGKSYQVVQNEHACELLDFIVDATGAHFETAGSLRGGREVFVTMKLPDTMRIAGVDDMDLYLAMCTSHDGSRLARVLVTPVRIVCANTQAAAFANNVGEYTLRHSGDIVGKLSEVRQALGLVPVYLDQFQAEAEKMIDKQLEWDQLQRIADQLWPLDDDDTEAAFLRKMARERDLKYLFEQAPTLENIRGTAWAGYQAITEWLDHKQPARSDYHRANKVLTDGTVTAIKKRAFDLVLAA